jgi:hypothetical protein
MTAFQVQVEAVLAVVLFAYFQIALRVDPVQ